MTEFLQLFLVIIGLYLGIWVPIKVYQFTSRSHSTQAINTQDLKEIVREIGKRVLFLSFILMILVFVSMPELFGSSKGILGNLLIPILCVFTLPIFSFGWLFFHVWGLKTGYKYNIEDDDEI